MALLAGKSIVIVGGTGGLGLSAARACAAEGAKLVLVGRNVDNCKSAEKELAGAAIAIAGDAADPAVSDAAVRQAVKSFGKLDGLYHVAGGSGRRMGDGPLHEITNEGWDATQRINMTGLFYSNRASARQFLEQKSGGAVLNMTSVLGWSPSPIYFVTHGYAAAKAAAIGMTRSCAAYYAKDNIRFNAIAPALVETPMAQRAAGDEHIMKFIATKQPLDGGRIGRVEDLDAAVVFLLSDGAKFVTGQTLAVDGGWDVSEGQV